MDRIKQALDRARAERQEAGRSDAVDSNLGTRQTGKSEDSVESIQYSQTAVQNLDLNLLADNRVVTAGANKEGLAAYKMLRTQVMQRMAAKHFNALAITSPMADDGKTLIAINLAISLARELHHTVLLVDMDLRNPSIHKYLGMTPRKGICDYILHGTPMNEILINPGIDRLVVLPGGDSVENSSEILASPKMGELVRELKSRYPSRMVLFDLPPVLMADDALSFAPYVDAFLLVLRDGKTTRAALSQAVEIMKETTLLGTVLNGAKVKTLPYY